MDTKPFWQSKTLLGILLLLLPTIAQKLGLKLSDADAQDLANLIVQIIGGIVGIWGRFSAKHELTVTAPPKVLAWLLLAGYFGAGALWGIPALAGKIRTFIDPRPAFRATVYLRLLALLAVLGASLGCASVKLPPGSYVDASAGANAAGDAKGTVKVHIPLGERRIDPPGAPFSLYVLSAGTAGLFGHSAH